MAGYTASLVSPGSGSPLNILANKLSQNQIAQETISPNTEGHVGSLVNAGTCSPKNSLTHNLSQDRMAQETISPSTKGHW